MQRSELSSIHNDNTLVKETQKVGTKMGRLPIEETKKLKMNHGEFIDILVSKGWNVEKNHAEVDYTKNGIAEKIAKTSDEFKQFIRSFNVLSNQEDNSWFLSLQDYLKENNEEGFAWDEFEIQSLEAADNDEEVSATKEFWHLHFPFMLSVKNGYAYFAIILEGADKGKIVIGNEPMYEETTVVAADLPQFFDLFISFLNGEISPAAFNILK